MYVLIGYDGSESAKDAITGLRRSGLPRDVDVVVASVADVFPVQPRSADESDAAQAAWEAAPIIMKARALDAATRAEAQALSVEGAALVTAEFPEWKVSHAAYAGSPYWALIQPPDRSADLIVVGAQGRSALGRLVMGSVSQNVLRHATCSVRISRPNELVRTGARGFAPVRIVLGIDGSRHSTLAVDAVARRAWPAETEVKIVTVLDAKFHTYFADAGRSSLGWPTPVGREEDGQAWAARAVAAVASQLRAAGLHPSTLVAEGDPKRVLVEQAEHWKADCIFVSAKGHSGLERFLLGSVSAGVAARAHCSVEVVR